MEATYVLYAQKAVRGRLLQVLAAHADGAVRWRERKRLFGSEFYLTGPAAAARKAHSALTEAAWLY